mgnify:CR=1 FL=1
MRWFIVHGRKCGDDDDTTMAFFAKSQASAVKKFKRKIGVDKDEDDVGDFSGLILISVWDCGENEPTCVM